MYRYIMGGKMVPGGHVWGRRLSEINQTAEGSLFIDHRSAVPLPRKMI